MLWKSCSISPPDLTYCPLEKRLGRASRSPCEWVIHLNGSVGREERSRLASCCCLTLDYKVWTQRTTKTRDFSLNITINFKGVKWIKKFTHADAKTWNYFINKISKKWVWCGEMLILSFAHGHTETRFSFTTHLTPPMSNQSFSQPSDDEESWMSIVTIVMEIRYPGNGAW